MSSRKMDLAGLYPQRKKGASAGKSKKGSKKDDSVHAAYRDAGNGSATFGSNVVQPAALVMAKGFDIEDEHDDIEEILKQFDMNMSYGPCVGMSRAERWARAERLGLNPPSDIKDLLERCDGTQNCLWEGRV